MIKNIIFDFGDIFINLDKMATYREMAMLGVYKISQEMTSTYHQYEKGLISTDEFVGFYQHQFPEIKKEKLIHAWNAILLDLPDYRLKFIKSISNTKKYRLFLLSNTNELHISWVQNKLGMKVYTDFKDCFEQFYLSHQIKLRKPDKNIYKFVLSENNLIASETLFVDDLKENTDAANALGILTWNLDPATDDVVNLLSREEFRN